MDIRHAERNKPMETPPEKQPLTTDDYLHFGGLYFVTETQLNAVMSRVAALQNELHDRTHRAWMEPHGTDAFCTPLSEAYAALGLAKSKILQSHAYASKTAKHLDIEPEPDEATLKSGGGCKDDPPPGP